MLTVAGLMAAGVVVAQTGQPNAQATGQGAASAAVSTDQVATSASANADASAQASLDRLRQAIDKKAVKTSSVARTRAETRIEATSKAVSSEADAAGDSKVAARLAGEFGMTTQAIMDEKAQLDASWGNLMIAHTLAASATNGVTVEQLLALQKAGMGWGQIAAGLGLNLGSAISSVASEGRVANGQAKADGKVAVIRGEGARAGMGAGVGISKAGVATHVGSSVGVKIGH